jgi:hypothetical protein
VRLHPFDDYPFHQFPLPFGMVATTDAKFNDGYWFGFYSADWYFLTVLRLHPNVNAIDGAVSAIRGGRVHSVRFSRALRPRADELSVGALTLRVLEPMQRFQLVLDENPAGIAYDVELTASGPPFVEDRYQHVKYGAIVNDTIRYTQVVRAAGWVARQGERAEFGDWYGLRDHSWGVRSSMGPQAKLGGTDRTEAEADRRAIRFWVPFECGDHSGFFHTHEDATGRTLDFEGRIDYRDGRSVGLDGVRHGLTYEPGSTRPSGGWIELLGADGEARRYALTATGDCADVHGLGYYRGWHDGGSSGLYRGPEHVEHDAYDQADGGPAHVKRKLGPTEYPCLMTGPDGGEGMAHLEHHIFGRYEPYGFA